MSRGPQALLTDCSPTTGRITGYPEVILHGACKVGFAVCVQRKAGVFSRR